MTHPAIIIATVKQLTEADFRIAYQGYGRAIRRAQDEPYPSEPYMSMDDAARLSAELVAESRRATLEGLLP